MPAQVRKLTASTQLVTEASAAFARAVQRAEKEASEAQAEAQVEIDAAAAVWQESEERAMASLEASEAVMAQALQATKDKEEAAQVAWAVAREAAASAKERGDALQRAQVDTAACGALHARCTHTAHTWGARHMHRMHAQAGIEAAQAAAAAECVQLQEALTLSMEAAAVEKRSHALEKQELQEALKLCRK